MRYHPAPRRRATSPRGRGTCARSSAASAPIRGVVALQIANEVNIDRSRPTRRTAPTTGAREALVQGVIAAKDEARRRGLRQLRDRLQLGLPDSIRRARRASGRRCATGAARRSCARSTGSASTPTRARSSRPPRRPDGYRDGMVNAMSAIRCYAKHPRDPGVGADQGGGERLAHLRRRAATQQQADDARAMVRAVHDFRGTYNVTRLPLVQPARLEDRRPGRVPARGPAGGATTTQARLRRLQRLVASSPRVSVRPRRAGPRLSLRLRYRAGRTRAGAAARAARVRATVAGADRRPGPPRGLLPRPPPGRPRHAAAAQPRRRPRRHGARAPPPRVAARVRLADGRLIRLKHRYVMCRRAPRG